MCANLAFSTISNHSILGNYMFYMSLWRGLCSQYSFVQF